jgi:dTMP kinase
VTREPSGGPIGAQIRLVLTQRIALPQDTQAEVMTLLFAADRLDHVASEIVPRLRDGYVVISDRYDLSSLAYQSITAGHDGGRPPKPPGPAGHDGGRPPKPPGPAGHDGGRPPKPPKPPGPAGARDRTAVVAWIRECNRFARRPDVTVVLDVSPGVAAARRCARGGAPELFDDADLQARLATAYLHAEALVPDDRVIHVDGDRDPDVVTRSVIEALDPFVSPPAAPRLG